MDADLLARITVWKDFDKRRNAMPVWLVAYVRNAVPTSRRDYNVISQGLTLDQAKTRIKALRKHNHGNNYQILLMPTAPRDVV